MKNFSNYKEVVNHQYIENCVSLFYQLAGDGNIPEVLRAAAVDAMGSISILSKNTLKHIALLYELAKNTFNHQLCSSSILALGEILNNFFGYIYELLTASDDGPSDSALEFISNEEINLVPILNLFSNLIQNTDMPENLRKAGIQALVDVIEALIAFWKLGNKNTNLEDAELEKEPLAIANVLSLLMMNDSLAPSLLSCLFQALDNLCSRFFFKNIISRLSENKRKDLLNDILGCKSTVLISYIENDNMDVKVRTHALQLFFRILIITKTLYFSSSFLLIPIILNDGFTFSQKMHALRLWYIIDKKSLLTKSMTDLLVQLFAEDDFLVKQALFTVISFNLMEHAKPFYLENNKLFFYDNNQLLSIELNAMPIEIYINELHDLKENLMQLITKDKSEMPFILPGKHIELSFFS